MKYRLANSSSFMVDLLNRAILVESYPHGQFLYFTLLNQKVAHQLPVWHLPGRPAAIRLA